MMHIADIRVRLTATAADGTRFVEEIYINGDQTYEQIWACAHSQADGSDPNPKDWPAAVWGQAMNLCKAECRLKAKLDAKRAMEEIPRDPTSGIYVPSSADQWSRLMDQFDPADHPIFNCEDAPEANLTDKVESKLLETGRTSYQQSVDGWSRKPRSTDQIFRDQGESQHFIGLVRLSEQLAAVAGVFARWKCTQHGCPDRTPAEHPIQPLCYTCGRPMGRVP